MKDLINKISIIFVFSMIANYTFSQTQYVSSIPSCTTWTNHYTSGTGIDYIITADVSIPSCDFLITAGTTVQFSGGSLTIPYDAKLTIEQGCSMQFGGRWLSGYFYGRKLIVEGQLIAGVQDSTQTVFTKISGTDGWGGIIFYNNTSGDNSIISNCKIEYALKTNTNTAYNYDYQGALYIDDFSDLTIEDCFFEYNTANYGGGIFATATTTISIENTDFTYNEAICNGGAVSLVADGDVYFENCSFSDNEAVLGGAIYANNSSLALNGGSISDNTASTDGGGLYLYASVVSVIEDVLFDYNTATTGNGGGIASINYCDVFLANCEISNNTVDDDGGGIYNYNSDLVLVNNLLHDNTADVNGGAIFTYDNQWPGPGTVDINNCTIADNDAYDGLGLYSTSPGVLSVVNTIIWETSGNPLSSDLSNVVGSAAFDHCDINDGNLSSSPNGNGTFNDDPDFVGSGDYRVHGTSPVSPCLDAGYNGVMPVGSYDFTGTAARIDDGDGDLVDEIDIGAYENIGGINPLIYLTTDTQTEYQDILIYPTFVNNVLNVITPESNNRINIYNTQGQLVKSGSLGASKNVIDCSLLKNGVYALTVLGNEKTINNKFIVLH